jgi:hypothetical protein
MKQPSELSKGSHPQVVQDVIFGTKQTLIRVECCIRICKFFTCA